ncbi:hypothetical protein [Niallia taxi]|uniref:hypothetical protein n=1 Tax=Niallia taxi TaxID=2499688 RepID=UPI00300BB61F
MMFKLPDEWIEKQQEIYNLKYITYQGKKIHVSELEDRSVTLEMRSQMRMNSYAQEDLPPKLNNEALIEKAKQYLGECNKKRIPCSTYDEALIHNITPELIKRLEEFEEKLDVLKNINSQELFFFLEDGLVNAGILNPNVTGYELLNYLKTK